MTLSSYQKWAKANPERAAYHNARRRKRADNRDRHGVWGVRLRLLRLHCGEFHTRLRDKDVGYAAVEVKLTIVELARLWFRDGAWMMVKPECDRLDPDGHYEFDNCRFIEKKDNHARRRMVGEREPGEEG